MGLPKAAGQASNDRTEADLGPTGYPVDHVRDHLVGQIDVLAELHALGPALQEKADAARTELVLLENIEEADLRAAPESFTPVWDQLFPAEQARIMQLLVEAVTYDAKTGDVAITFRAGGVRVLASEKPQEAD